MRGGEAAMEAAAIAAEDLVAGGQRGLGVEAGLNTRVAAVVGKADLVILVGPGVAIETEQAHLVDRLEAAQVAGDFRRAIGAEKHAALAPAEARVAIGEQDRLGVVFSSDQDSRALPGEQIARAIDRIRWLQASNCASLSCQPSVVNCTSVVAGSPRAGVARERRGQVRGKVRESISAWCSPSEKGGGRIQAGTSMIA